MCCAAVMMTALLAGCSSSTEQATDNTAAAGSAAVADTGAAADTGSGAQTPEDGVYTAQFDTDSGMFHVNEANDGRGTLTVKNGEMTIHVSLVSKRIVNLYPGKAADAEQADDAALLQPTTDTVTYSDGLTEDVYGFDIPVPALEQQFDLALVGTEGKWYDHKVSVSDVKPAE